ncbi:MAG TPA: S8 family serine peptidase [Pyrinomonadaceae bacterium]
MRISRSLTRISMNNCWLMLFMILSSGLFSPLTLAQEPKATHASRLHFQNGYLLWLDSSSKSIYRLKTDSQSGPKQSRATIDMSAAERIWTGAPLIEPTDITIDEAGKIYVSDRSAGAIFSIVAGAAPQIVLSSAPLQKPTSLAAVGHWLFFTDADARKIFALDLSRKEIVEEYKFADSARVADTLRYSDGNLIAFDTDTSILYRFALDESKLKTQPQTSEEWKTLSGYSNVTRSELIDFRKAVRSAGDVSVANNVAYVLDKPQLRVALIPLDGGEASFFPYAQLFEDPVSIFVGRDEIFTIEGNRHRIKREPVVLPATLFFEGMLSSSQMVEFYNYLYDSEQLPVKSFKISSPTTLGQLVLTEKVLPTGYTPEFDALFCKLNVRFCAAPTITEAGAGKSLKELSLEQGQTIALPDIAITTYTAKRNVSFPLDPQIYKPAVFKDLMDKPLGLFAEALAPSWIGADKLKATLENFNPVYRGPNILEEKEGFFVIPIEAARIRLALRKQDLLNSDSQLNRIVSRKNVTGFASTSAPYSNAMRPARSNLSAPRSLLSFFISSDCQATGSNVTSRALDIIGHCLPQQTFDVPAVAVVDNKFNSSHPAFIEADGQSALHVFTPPNANVDRRPLNDLTRPNPTTFVRDLDHGTHIAAIIAARATNAQMVGVYPAARLHGVLAEDLNQFIEAQNNSVRLFNISLGEQPKSDGANLQPFSGTELLKAVVLQNPFPLFVISAGNEGREVEKQSLASLSYLDNVLVVAASTTPPNTQPLRLLRSDGAGSNFGARWVGIAAPGENILSALYNGEYGSADGTSQSSAFVSGVAAALMAVEPNWLAWQIKFRLIATADLWTDTDQSGNVLAGEVDMRRVVLDTKVVVTEDEVRGVCRGQIDPAARQLRLELRRPTRSIPLGNILRVRRHKTDATMYTIIYYEEKETDNDPARRNRYIRREIIRASSMRANHAFNFLVTSPSPTCSNRRVDFKELTDFVNNFSLSDPDE